MRYRSALYNVRGLGSAKDGTHHFWMQRLTAIALVPLTLWLTFGIAGMGTLGYTEAATWLRSPINAVLMLATVLALFYHFKLGVQVVIEDYVHHEAIKLASLIAVNFLSLLLGLASALAVLRVATSG